jgi:integrase
MAGKKDAEKTEVTFGAAKASVWPRGDGRWAVSWQENGKGRSTTIKDHEDALKRAKKIVRGLVAGLGSREVTVEDAELLQRLRRICGDRHPSGVLQELEDAMRELKGTPLTRVVNHWKASGMGDVEAVRMQTAVRRFLNEYDDNSVWTRAGVRKELKAFYESHADGLCVCEVTTEALCEWIGRDRLDGTKIAPRFWNNRLATWVTFFNRCRDWKMWPRGEKHPAELLEKRKEPRGAVPIWTPEEAHGILSAVQTEMPRQVPYIVIGCWLGLRPTEITRLTWKNFDWKRGYVHADEKVARKLQEERYVPLNAKARALLEAWLRSEGLWDRAVAGELEGKCALVHDREMVSILVRRRKIITRWPQDVMRHSYISYRIAQGDSKHEIAEAAGNSESIIRRKYRRPLMKEDGAEWFRLV